MRLHSNSFPIRTRCGGAALTALLIFFNGCSHVRDGDWIAEGRRCMVAADHPLASRAGLEVLRAGGNAVDAAIAVSLTLAVVRPESTGLGGGGFMIVRTADGAVTALDYRERAPAASTADMFTQARAMQRSVDDAEPLPPSQYGYLAVAVPGLLCGLEEAHTRWGTLPWTRLAAPALRAADEGFAVDAHYVDATRGVARTYASHSEIHDACGYLYRVHLRSGDLRQAGDTLQQPELAGTLRAIGEIGPGQFARVHLAPALAEVMQRHGGIVTAADLADYQVSDRPALRGTYRGYDLIAMPPPSSGGICLIEALNILEHVPLPALLRHDPALALHYIVEAEKHAFADRARWLGDSDYVRVPTGFLTSKDYAGVLAESLDPDRTAAPSTYGAQRIPDDAGTSHFCVVDRWGNCVVSTETINTSFGSLAAVDRWGIILNNEMDDFSAEPGRANAFGLMQSERNAVAPGKRPLSSMTPTLVLRDGQPVLLLGASGGPRIITAVLNVLLRVLDGGASLADAMTAPRVHHQWAPNAVYFDDPPPQAWVAGLEARGHEVSQKPKVGVVQAILVKPGKLVGGSDPRKGGQPAGD